MEIWLGYSIDNHVTRLVSQTICCFGMMAVIVFFHYIILSSSFEFSVFGPINRFEIILLCFCLFPFTVERLLNWVALLLWISFCCCSCLHFVSTSAPFPELSIYFEAEKSISIFNGSSFLSSFYSGMATKFGFSFVMRSCHSIILFLTPFAYSCSIFSLIFRLVCFCLFSSVWSLLIWFRCFASYFCIPIKLLLCPVILSVFCLFVLFDFCISGFFSCVLPCFVLLLKFHLFLSCFCRKSSPYCNLSFLFSCILNGSHVLLCCTELHFCFYWCYFCRCHKYRPVLALLQCRLPSSEQR